MRLFTSGIVAASLLVLASAGPALSWGAIAVDDESGLDPEEAGYGSATGYDNRADAANDAMAACQNEGNDNCRIALTFQKCGAYAASLTLYGVGRAATLKEAEQRALADCGAADCRLVVSDCE